MSYFETLLHLFRPQRSNNHRPRILHPEGFFVLALIAIGFSLLLHASLHFMPRIGSVLGYATSISASDVVQQVNQQRAISGLPTLTVNEQLNQAATAKAAYMFSHQYWAHFAPDGTSPWKFFADAGYQYSIAGENLARDFSITSDMVAAWMASPTHKANIMNQQFHETGVAVVNGRLLGVDTTLVVQLFGTPRTNVAQVSPDGSAITLVGGTLGADQPQALQQVNQPQVEGTTVLPVANLTVPPLFSPLQLTKAFFLAIIFIIIGTLVYDAVVMNHQQTVRLVGKNLAHIILFVIVAFLLIFFKGGIIQ